MSFIFAVLRQVFRNFRQTWVSQLMTMLTVSLSVFIFAFFYLVYNNMLSIGDKLGYDLRLIVYLEEEPIPELQEQLRRKILAFDEVDHSAHQGTGSSHGEVHAPLALEKADQGVDGGGGEGIASHQQGMKAQHLAKFFALDILIVWH